MAIKSSTTRPMARSGIAALNAAARRNQRNGASGADAVIDAAKAAQLNYVREEGTVRLYRSRRGALVVAWLEGAQGGAGFDDQIGIFNE